MIDPSNVVFTNGANPAQDTVILWSFLAPFLQEIDMANNFQFMAWLDGIGQQQQIIDALVRDTTSGPGWSPIMDVSRCPDYALPWLAQWVGTRFTSQELTNTAYMRSAIINTGNFARGTTNAIVNAITPFLEPGGYVQLIERTPDPYSFQIIIHGDLGNLTYADLAAKDPLYSEVATEYPTYADFPVSNADQVTAAIAAATPGGLIFTVTFA